MKNAITGFAALFAVVAVTGCGIELDSTPASAGVEGDEAVVRTNDGVSGQPRAQRVARSQGVVRIAGQAQGSLTERLDQVLREFRDRGPGELHRWR